MRLEEIGGDRGPTTNHAEQALLRRRMFSAQMAELALPDLYVVNDYDHMAGTVDLVKKTAPDPTGTLIQGVPVHGMGGSLRTYYGFRTLAAQAVEPDVGWLIFPKTDSRRAFLDFVRRIPPSSRILQPFGAEFFPCTNISAQTITPNLVATGPGKATEVAPLDKALLDPITGAGIIIKSGTGRVVLVGDVYLLEQGQDFGDAKPIARKDDPTTCPAGSGTITDGSAHHSSG